MATTPVSHPVRPTPVVHGLPRSGPFRGWVVVAGAFMTMFLGFGMAYSFAAFFTALADTFAASRADVAVVFSICGFLYFSLGAVSGALADRLGPRVVIGAGLALIAAGLVAASQARTLTQIYLTYSVAVGVGVGFSYVPSIGAVQRWFVRRRGLASGVAVSGIGLGTLLVPPFAAWLIDVGGWRFAYGALGAVTLVLGVVATLLVDRSPEVRGQAPDGAPPERVTGSEPRRPDGMTLGEAVRTPPFWLLYAACAALGFGLFIPFVHLTPYAIDRGVAPQTAVLLFSLIGIGSTAGRFLLGGIADRLGRWRSLVGMFSGIALMLALWPLADGVPALAAFALLFGTFYGGFVALMPALTADYFGARSVGAIIGWLYTSVAVGTLAGPTLAGAAHDVTGSYTPPILGAAALTLVAVAVTLLAGEPKPRQG